MVLLEQVAELVGDAPTGAFLRALLAEKKLELPSILRLMRGRPPQAGREPDPEHAEMIAALRRVEASIPDDLDVDGSTLMALTLFYMSYITTETRVGSIAEVWPRAIRYLQLVSRKPVPVSPLIRIDVA